MATSVRPRTAPAPHSEALRQERRPISLLQPEVFPNLERFHGVGNKVHGGGGGRPLGPSRIENSCTSLALDAFLHKNQERSGDTVGGANDGVDGERPPIGKFHAHAHDMACLEQWMAEMLDLHRGSAGKLDGGGCERGSRDVPAGKENLTWLYSQKAVRYGVVFEELIRQVAVHSERLATLVAKAFKGHDTLLNRLIRVHDAREGELQRMEAQLRGLTGETNRKMHEEEALIEEQQFLENLTKVELRESRALASSLRVKLKYYGEEVARLRQVVLDKVTDDDIPRSERVHNSLTTGGVGMPAYPKSKPTMAMGKQSSKKGHQETTDGSVADGVVTILSLSTEKLNMHANHEKDLTKWLSQLSAESRTQTQDMDTLSRLVDGIKFESFLKGISKEGRRAAKRTRQTQTRPTKRETPSGDDSRPGTGSGGRKKPPKKTKGSKSEMLPLDLRTSIGMTSSPKKVPTLGYMLRTVLDIMLVWSRSLDTVVNICEKPGGMTEVAIKHFQLLHGMEITTHTMLAQFAAGLVHFVDYKRCKVLGELLGVDNVAKPPPLDHRSAAFLFRLLAELRTVGVFGEEILKERIVKIVLNKMKCARAARTILGPLLPQGSPPVTTLMPCLQDANMVSSIKPVPGMKRMTVGTGEVPLAKQTVEFDDLLPEAMAAHAMVMKHRVSHIHLAFERYCSTFQVTEELRFGTDDAPKCRDVVVMQLSKHLVDKRERRQLYAAAMNGGAKESGEGSVMMRLMDGIEQAQEDRQNVSALTGAAQERAMGWVLERSGEATCMEDYISMHAPVVELLSKEDLALAINYLNPTLSQADTEDLYDQGCRNMWDNTHTLFRGLWAQEETELGKKYWVHTVQDITQWALPFNVNDFRREEIGRDAFVALCLGAKVLDDSPLAQHFLGPPQALWDDWDNIVAVLGRKVDQRQVAGGRRKLE